MGLVAVSLPSVSDAAQPTVDADSDRDGLSDFQEQHKYFTDPHSSDTAGKGVLDGDATQRREFTYSVKAKVRVMRPYNVELLSDDYQDARVLKETPEYADVEIVVYPLNTNAHGITENLNWRTDYAGMQEYLKPRVATNWDESLHKELLQQLAANGIDPASLSDKQVVEQVTKWLFNRSKHRNMFCTFYVDFKDGNPFVIPGLERAFANDQGDPNWTVQEQFDHELFGKGMFARKTYGTCTSTAVYQTTVLRALGIPTRMILCIPLADSSDQTQVDMISEGLSNHRVRSTATLGVVSAGTSFASHTFCEVFVGNRWRRLNYTTLGQNVLSSTYLGLMLKVHTFNDLSDADLGPTWGVRYVKRERDEALPYNNPYRLLRVSDRFGEFAKVENPPADNELRTVTIETAYWGDSTQTPGDVRNWSKPPGSGQFLIHCREWLDNAGDYLQYKLFMRRSDDRFLLKADGHPDVACRLSHNFYTQRSKNLRELEVIIPRSQYERMATDVEYKLTPQNEDSDVHWQLDKPVTLTRR